MFKKVLFILILIVTLCCCGCDKYKNFLSVHIIDVGQGDCILIKTPANKNILIDGGDEDCYRIIKSYLKFNNVKKLDIVIATHFDKDHVGSLDNIIKDSNIPIGKVYTPNEIGDSSPYFNLINACNSKKIKINHLSKGNHIKISDSINLNVLSPSYIQEDSNENSIVINLQYDDMDFLFTGDCEEANEIEITNNFNLEDIDFLKVAHHGSKSSSSDKFIKEVSPSIAAISCGYKNQYGHPHKSTLDTLFKYNCKVFRTDKNGDLVFYSDGHKIFTTKKYK